MFTKIATAACLLAHPVRALEFGSAKIGDRPVTTVSVDPKKDALRLFHKDDAQQPLKRLDRLAEWRRTKGETLLFGMNAGMYHGDFSSVGLHVENGRQFTPINLATGAGNFFLKPNGVFLLTSKGASVMESSEAAKVKEPLMIATQSGPLLLRRGQMHPVFDPKSKNKLIRNGVGVTARGLVIFAISEAPVSFHEFATFFRDQMHCPDALFLDGTVSSLYAPALKRNDFRMDLGPMIGVVKPSP
jgi:uncharacterized protein YigE (DUF2233 family)